MGNIILLLAGATLFLNGKMTLGKADARNVAVFNLFVGSFQVLGAFYLIIVSEPSNAMSLGHASIFLFGFTYLYLGITILKGMDGSGLGYFSLWVSILSVVYATVEFAQYGDMVKGLNWVLWSFLWGMFYLTNCKKLPISEFVGKISLVLSWVTLTIPSLLTLTGVFDNQTIYKAWAIVLVVSIIYIGYLGYLLFYKKKEKTKAIAA
ncbi:AmiS/UreI family transporter [Peribacillus sp. NPDC097206]|uniref:AmiS/UreI family transporter n=1 Tax=unclassified Peribacillus TaxID=2675266 RepID=UPI00380CE769